MRNSFRSPELQAQFAEQGYVIVPLLTPDEAVCLRAKARLAIALEPTINDPQGALYNSEFDSERRANGTRLATDIIGRTEAILDDYRDAGGCIMAKIAGSGSLVMHQHQPQTEDVFDVLVNCWLTLDDVGPETGALRVVPRSQRILRHIQSFNSKPYFTDFAAALEDQFAVTLPMRAGEAVFFENSLLHGSCPNRSSEPLLRLLSMMLPAERSLCVLTEGDDATFEAFEIGHETFDPRLRCIAGGDVDSLRRRGRLANRNTRISVDEFETLIELGDKICPGHDPIDTVRSRRGPFPALTDRWRRARKRQYAARAKC